FVEDGRLWAGPPGGLPADLVVALPHLTGPALPGLPADAAGFTLVDGHGAIGGAAGGYAMGNRATREPPSDGGAQADAVARRITGTQPGPAVSEPWPRLGPFVRAHGQDVAPLG